MAEKITEHECLGYPAAECVAGEVALRTLAPGARFILVLVASHRSQVAHVVSVGPCSVLVEFEQRDVREFTCQESGTVVRFLAAAQREHWSLETPVVPVKDK